MRVLHGLVPILLRFVEGRLVLPVFAGALEHELIQLRQCPRHRLTVGFVDTGFEEPDIGLRAVNRKLLHLLACFGGLHYVQFRKVFLGLGQFPF